MMVLRILGIVLCVVLFVFVVLTAFTLFAPARIEIKRDMPNGQLKVRLGFGPIKKVFRLGGKRKKTKKPTKKQKKKEKLIYIFLHRSRNNRITTKFTI